MTEADVRQLWLAHQEADLAQATANKMPQDALLHSAARYRQLSEEDRPIIDALLLEQVLSLNEDDRFLALAIIEDFKIASAVPALRRLAEWLESEDWPGAPYEWAKVNRLIARLAHPEEQ